MKKTGSIFMVFFLLLMVSSTGSFAQNEAELQGKVDILTQRVAELERQLQEQSSPSNYQDPFGSMSQQWDPFADMQLMRQRMNQMMGQAMSMSPTGLSSGLFDPETDLKETADSYLISMDLPGMDKSKINIEAKNGMLMISGERSSSMSEDGDRFYRQERSFGYFSRSVPLPENADKENIDANYENGVLSITIGKKVTGQKVASGTQIKVK